MSFDDKLILSIFIILLMVIGVCAYCDHNKIGYDNIGHDKSCTCKEKTVDNKEETIIRYHYMPIYIPKVR